MAGLDWGTIIPIAGLLIALFGWLKWDIKVLGDRLGSAEKKLGERLGVVERELSYLRGRLDGPPDSIQHRPPAG